MQSQRSPSTGKNRLPTVLLLAILAAALLVPSRVSSANYVNSLTATNSSAECYYAFSIHSLLNSFSCGIKTTAGTVLVVFLGCLSGTSTACDNATVVDTENNTYTYPLSHSGVSCDGSTCEEYAFLATTSSTGNDTLTFATAGTAYLGGDIYDVLGINASNYVEGTGASPMNAYADLTQDLPDTYGRFVAAGFVANNALQFSTSGYFNYIPGQPCYTSPPSPTQCGQNGGWQASEYQTVGDGEGTSMPFNYPQTSDGWAELALSIAPNLSTTSISCTPSPAMVTLASTCTATVRGDSPTGTITWTATGNGTFSHSSCTLSSGTCSVSYTPSAPPSSVTITASYGGDLFNPVSSGSYLLSAGKDATTETVRCAPSPAAAGSTTTCTARVAGYFPGGTITWTTSGVANFSPAATCTLSAGACAVNYVPSPSSIPITITAVYSGDGNNRGSTGTFQLSTVQAQTTTSTSSSTSSLTASSTVASVSSTATQSSGSGTGTAIASSTTLSSAQPNVSSSASILTSNFSNSISPISSVFTSVSTSASVGNGLILPVIATVIIIIGIGAALLARKRR